MSALSQPIALLLISGIIAGVGVLVVVLGRLGQERAEKIAVAPSTTAPRRVDRRTRRLDEALAASPILRRAVDLTANLASRKGALGAVERSLRAADVPVRPAEVILGHLAAAIVIPVVVLVATQSIGKAIFAVVICGVGPPLALRFLAARRLKRFGDQLPDALTILAGSLRAGRSVGQAMEALSREMGDPMGREMRKVVAEVRLGRSLHEALTDAVDRVHSADFRWAVLAMQIQSEVGGNLAELLDQVASTMRERTRMRGEVKALTAEGRASAIMLVVMVPALGGAMAAMNPEYMKPLFTTSTGHIMLGISTFMIGGGYLWMSRMAKIDV